MGKKYYCDYCDKTMVAKQSIIRTHMNGVVHKKLVADHYQQYKDAKTIVEEEKMKKRCIKYMKGTCQFGSLCRYTHFTDKELNDLEASSASKKDTTDSQPAFEDLYQQLENDKITESSKDEKNTVIYDESGITHVLPWRYNHKFDGYKLTSSIRRLRTKDFSKAVITNWG